MKYQEKLAYVLEAAVLVSNDDLDKLYEMAVSMTRAEAPEKAKQDRAALCSFIPYLDKNDTELLCSSARMCKNPR